MIFRKFRRQDVTCPAACEAFMLRLGILSSPEKTAGDQQQHHIGSSFGIFVQ
jgi:hypothetical protein